MEQGASFSTISVEQLITGAAIARSTFYVYFEDKGALLVELADRVTREVGDAASGWFQLQAGATRDDLKRALGLIVKEYGRHRHMFNAVVEAAAYDPRVRREYAGIMERRFDDVATALREQQLAGLIAADVEVAAAAPWLTWMIEHGLNQLTADSPDVADESLDGMTTVVWETLYERALARTANS